MIPDLRRLLIPLDGSEEGMAALEAVSPLARRPGARVTLLHVAEDSGDSERARRVLAEAGEKLRAEGVPVSLSVRGGRAADGILAAVEEEGADLIAMTTHGRTGLRRLVLGSVTEEVLRRSSVPVLTCRPGAPGGAWKTIVVALDGTAPAEEVLPDAAALAEGLGAELHLVRVALPILIASGAELVPGVLLEEDPKPYLQSVSGRLAALGVAARPVPLEGRAAGEIARYAREAGAGLVCLTTRGRRGAGRVLLGSIAEEVVRHAPCPVLVRRVGTQAVRWDTPVES